MAVLAALDLWWGAWARLAPRQFFDVFPGSGHHWTAAYPPYNEHLVTDLGSTFLTLAFFLVVGAWVNDRRLRRVVLSGVVLFNALHLSFHATDHGTMGSVDLGESLAVLAGGVIGPAVLLLVDAIQPTPTIRAGRGTD
jgi:Na+-transporting NADH:ubiquinone oxidoreductase subunit NqrB